MRLRLFVLTVVGSAGLLASACQETPTPQAAVRVESEYDPAGKLTRLSYDRNGDGQLETWGYMDGTRVVRVEVDENGDGNVDLWEYHHNAPVTPGSAPAGVDKTVERIERATRHDGRITRREYFADGSLTRVEEDTDGNGTIDKWETYKDGVLQMIALDTTGRGAPDRRLIYGRDGSVKLVEADPAGTGTFKTIPQ